MKWMLFFLGLLSFGCSNNKRKAMAGGRSFADTVVKVVNIPIEISSSGYVEKEYFLVIRGDTSSYSLNTAYNKTRKELSMIYCLQPSKTGHLFLKADSVTVGNSDETEKPPVRKIGYGQQLREIQLLLNAASKENNMSQLHVIRVGLSVIEVFSRDVTQQYVSSLGSVGGPIQNNEVANLIEKSDFLSDLNKILSTYGIKIDKTFVDNPIVINEDENCSGGDAVESHSSGSPNLMIDAMIIFTLGKIG